MPPEPLSFTAYQAAFAARIRDPAGAPRPPGAPARGMRVYQELVFDNLDGFLSACYPVTRKLLGARAWRRMVRQFMREHRCHSPLFRDIPKAALDWSAGRAEELFPHLPFLAELMHYEWLELAVETAPDDGIAPQRLQPDGDLLAGRPMLHPTARLACYRYPVHRIGPRCKPGAAESATHCYLLWRDDADAVRFILLSPLAAHLLALLQEQARSARDALAQLATEAGPGQLQHYLDAGRELLDQLHAQGALLGTWSAT